MNDREKILLELRMLDEGIVPNTSHKKNVEDQLSTMSPEDARKAKRKWRKIKRKALKRSSGRIRKKLTRCAEKYVVLLMLAQDRNT